MSEQIEEITFDRIFINNQAWKTELEVAVKDLLHENFFSLIGSGRSGPYALELEIADKRLVLNTSCRRKTSKIAIPTSPFRRVIKDYFILFDSYEEAMNLGHHGKLEAIDMGRRGLHNEGAELLMDLVDEEIETDLETARRLFTIITVLHLKPGVGV